MMHQTTLYFILKLQWIGKKFSQEKAVFAFGTQTIFMVLFSFLFVISDMVTGKSCVKILLKKVL